MKVIPKYPTMFFTREILGQGERTEEAIPTQVFTKTLPPTMGGVIGAYSDLLLPFSNAHFHQAQMPTVLPHPQI